MCPLAKASPLTSAAKKHTFAFSKFIETGGTQWYNGNRLCRQNKRCRS